MSEARNNRPIPYIAWLPFGVTIASILAGFLLMAIGCRELLIGLPYQRLLPITQATSSLFFSIIGILILQRNRDQGMGWLCLAIGAVAALKWNYATIHGACQNLEGSGALAAFWLTILLGVVDSFLTFVLLPMLYPHGRFLSRRWRSFTSVGALWVACLLLPLALLPGPMRGAQDNQNAPDNPFPLGLLPEEMGAPLGTALLLSMFLMAATAILCVSLRYRRSHGESRQQMKWFVYYLVAVILPWAVIFEVIGALFYPEIFATVLYAIATFVVVLGFPLVIGIAVLRYRLYDIDIIIRRTLVYALVTGTLVLIYFVSIVLLQRIFVTITGQQSTIAIVVSTLLIAALFNPLRQRAQKLIDRRFYRDRYDVEQTLARFAMVARDEVNLETLTHELHSTVQDALQPNRVSVWLDEHRPERWE